MKLSRLFLFIFVLLLLINVTPNMFIISVSAAYEDLTGYNEADALNRISTNTNGTRVNITAMQNTDDNLYLMQNLLAVNGAEIVDWSVSFDIYSPVTGIDQRNSILVGCGFSDTLGDLTACGTEYWCGFYITDPAPYQNRMRLGKDIATGKSGAVSLNEGQWYYAYFNRSGNDLVYSVYSDDTRTDAFLVESLSYNDALTTPFKYFYAAQSADREVRPANHNTWYMREFELTVDGCLVPDAPTNGVVDYDASTTTINLTWTKGVNANNTIIRYKTTGYPTSYTDGNLWYNGTDTWYENNGIDTTKFYYIRAWSEANWSSAVGDIFKYSDTYLQFDYGTLKINVYDENTSDVLNKNTDEENEWSIFISNQNGTDTYEDETCSNYLELASTDIPYGTNTIIFINATNYSSRVYYFDFEFGEMYNLSLHLPPSNSSEGYLLTVENEYNEPVEDVNVFIMKYINVSTGWANVSCTITDGSGQTLVYLMYDNLYKVRVNKSGYLTSIYDYVPTDLLFTKTFRILFETEEYMNESAYHEIIDFICEIGGGNLYVNFTCNDGNIIRTNIMIYNISNTTGTRNYFDSDNRTGDNSFNLIFPIEAGMCYEVTLNLSHSIFGTFYDFRTVCDRDTITTTGRFDTIFDLNFKYNPFGWSNTFGFFLLLATMFSFGQEHVGLSMLMTGGVMIFINSIIGLALISVGISLGIVTLGIIVLWGERGVKS